MPLEATAVSPPIGVALAAPEGLRSATVAVTAAEAPHVVALRRELWSRWEPADAVEVDQVEALLVVRLKEARLDGLELEVLAARGDERAALHSLAALGRYRRQLERQQASIEAAFVAFRDALGTPDAVWSDATGADATEADATGDDATPVGTAPAAAGRSTTPLREPIGHGPASMRTDDRRDTDEPEGPRAASVDGIGRPSALAA